MNSESVACYVPEQNIPRPIQIYNDSDDLHHDGQLLLLCTTCMWLFSIPLSHRRNKVSACGLVFTSVILFFPVCFFFLIHFISGGETGTHTVPVENWSAWAEGEGVWDETLEWGSGHKHASRACCSPFSGLQKEGWGEECCPGCFRIQAAQMEKKYCNLYVSI